MTDILFELAKIVAILFFAAVGTVTFVTIFLDTFRILALQRRVRELEATLRHIAYMDCYTRDGEEPAHELMMRLARNELLTSRVTYANPKFEMETHL